MIGLRQAGYCNLKALLICLVIYGHWIEPGAGSSWVYRLIYLIHMPLFAFLTGLFVRREEDCLRQLRRLLPVYCAAQAVPVLLGWKPLVPWWHLWYLLSCCFWLGAGWLWLRLGWRRGVGVAVLVGILAGFVPWLGRTLSLSRTVVYFPFFLAGLLRDPETPWHKFRPWAPAALGAAVIGFWVLGQHMDPRFLTQADPYRGGGEAWLRLGYYIISGLLGFFLLTWMPRRRLVFSRLGADTLPAYLFHAPIVLVLRELCPGALLGSIALLWGIHMLTQWNGPMRGIISRERGD